MAVGNEIAERGLHMLKYGKNKRFKMWRAVKESFDDLPSGVCFFDENGLIVLCNQQMQRIVFALSGHDLQSLFELEQIMEKGNFVRKLPDGTVWKFEQTQLKKYIQVTASDVTQLHDLCDELEKENRKLAEEGKKIRELSENVMELTRQEEILKVKMEVHKQFGDGLAKLRHCLKEGKPVDEADIQQWKQAIRLLQQENKMEETERESLEKIQQMAESVGVQIQGDNIWKEEWCLLAVRECVTNTARHAGGNRVTVRCEMKNQRKVLTITNNGRKPEKAILEGGGLASLRNCVERLGGKMLVQTQPVFMLTITMPEERGKR
mgnify:FL=1